MKRSLRFLLLGIAVVSLVTVTAVLFNGTQEAKVPQKNNTPVSAVDASRPVADHYAVFNTNMGSFTVRLYGNKAPITVKNFDSLVDNGFYNGLTFHRVIDGFMIQGGDPAGNGTGGPGYAIPDEFAKDLHFDKAGILAMANSGPNTGGSQFFITLAPTPWLDNRHTIFGVVVKGLEVVEKIGKTKTGRQDKPVNPVVIESVTLQPLQKGSAEK